MAQAHWWRRVFGDERGQSIVEFALALPILTFGLIGGADLARAFAIQLAVQNAARAGAEAAAITATGPNGLATGARAIDEANRTPFLNVNNATVTISFKQADGIADCVNPPTIALQCYATVRVQYTFNTIVPWPIIPTSATFDRTTVMRTIGYPSGPTSCTYHIGPPATCP